MTEFGMIAQQTYYCRTSCAKDLRRLPVGQDDRFRFSSHLQNHPVIIRADWIGHLKQPSFVSGAVGVDVADKLPAVAPSTGERGDVPLTVEN
jgi:hypothetical protein